MKKRGFVFSIDAVFALYITLIATSALFAVLEVSQQPGSVSLELSRLSWDVLEIQKAPFPTTALGDISTGEACSPAYSASSAKAAAYKANSASNGYEGLKSANVRVCVR